MTEQKQDEKPKEKPAPRHDNYTYPLLKDVAGDAHFKQTLEDIVNSISLPQIYHLMGVKEPKTFLFYGPPGTGKSFSYKAIRNELLHRGIRVLELQYNIGAQGSPYINMNSVIVQKFFDLGRKAASKGRTVLYWMDEADVILSKRRPESINSKEDEKMLTTLMKNLQAITMYSTREYVFFATNFVEGMDEAALRSGRIDQRLLFNYPTLDSLTEAYRLAIERINTLAMGDPPIQGYDPVELAQRSAGLSFADVNFVIESTVRGKVLEYLRTANDEIIQLTPIQTQDFYPVIQQLKEQHKKKRIGFK